MALCNTASGPDEFGKSRPCETLCCESVISRFLPRHEFSCFACFAGRRREAATPPRIACEICLACRRRQSLSAWPAQQDPSAKAGTVKGPRRGLLIFIPRLLRP